MKFAFFKKLISSISVTKDKSRDTLSSATDEKLIELFNTEGNKEAFEEIFNRYANRVYGLAFRVSRNQIDAEDIFQDVFLTLFKKLNTFKGKASFTTWLDKVTINASYMHYRSSGKKYESEISLENYNPYDDQGTLRGRIKIKDWSDRPDDILFSREAMEAIERAIQELPEIYRIVIHFRDIQEKSNEEVANILGIQVGTVKSRLHRARLFLRDKLSDYFYEWRG